MWVRVIAAFKLFKAVLLIGAGIGALQLLQPETAQRVQQWTIDLAQNTGLGFVRRLLSFVTDTDQTKKQALGIGAVVYGTLFAVEGVGLWLRKRWAEYLTIVATGIPIPFELYGLARQFTAFRLIAATGNVATVAYLVYRVRRESKPTGA